MFLIPNCILIFQLHPCLSKSQAHSDLTIIMETVTPWGHRTVRSHRGAQFSATNPEVDLAQSSSWTTTYISSWTASLLLAMPSKQPIQHLSSSQLSTNSIYQLLVCNKTDTLTDFYQHRHCQHPPSRLGHALEPSFPLCCGARGQTRFPLTGHDTQAPKLVAFPQP